MAVSATPCAKSAVFNEFLRLVSDASGWAYAIVLALALLDAVLPIVPSEASVITAGVVAASGGMNLELVILAAAVGAFLGDNLGYLIGYRFGPAARKRFFHGKKSQKSLEWADRQLDKRGGDGGSKIDASREVEARSSPHRRPRSKR